MEKKKDWLGIVFAIYDIFGVVPGSIIQMVVSAIVVIFSIRGR